MGLISKLAVAALKATNSNVRFCLDNNIVTEKELEQTFQESYAKEKQAVKQREQRRKLLIEKKCCIMCEHYYDYRCTYHVQVIPEPYNTTCGCYKTDFDKM